MGFERDPMYVEVGERVALFHTATDHLGTLRPVDPDQPYRIERLTLPDADGLLRERAFVVYTAMALRCPTDSAPGIGTAWEPLPGSTPYTRDSELMNAETSAWGRAIVATGLVPTNRGIASYEEVRARQQRDQLASPKALADVAWWMMQAAGAGVDMGAERMERLMTTARESDTHAASVVRRIGQAIDQHKAAGGSATNGDDGATVARSSTAQE